MSAIIAIGTVISEVDFFSSSSKCFRNSCTSICPFGSYDWHACRPVVYALSAFLSKNCRNGLWCGSILSFSALSYSSLNLLCAFAKNLSKTCLKFENNMRIGCTFEFRWTESYEWRQPMMKMALNSLESWKYTLFDHILLKRGLK